MHCTHCMTSLFSNLLSCSIWPHDCVTITVTISSDVTDVWQYDCDITLTLALDSKIKIWKEKRKRTLNSSNFLHSNFLHSKLLQATHQYSQLSGYIIKLPFIHFLTLLQYSVVFQSLLVSSAHLLICFSIL